MKRTPSQTIGPFFHEALRWPGGERVRFAEKGEAIMLTGRLLDGAGEALADSLIETWQLSPSGKVPSASANDWTKPLLSAVCRSWRANAVPEVPRETTTSPGCRPRPRAAPMLSPVPGATAMPERVRPTTSAGPATRGTASSRPAASRSRSRRYSRVAAEK